MPNKKQPALLTEREAYDYALKRLSIRDYSQKDLEGKLRLRGCPSLIIAKVMGKLLDYNFINEEGFGQKVYNYWLSKKYYGRQHLRLDLMKKQVREDLIPAIVNQLSHAEEEQRAQAFAQSVLRRKDKKYAPDNIKARAAMARALSSRGFGSGIISGILAEIYNNNTEVS